MVGQFTHPVRTGIKSLDLESWGQRRRFYMLGVSVNLRLCSPDFVYVPIFIFAIIIGKYDKHMYRKIVINAVCEI